jgi:amidase
VLIDTADFEGWDGTDMAELVRGRKVSGEDLAETARHRMSRLRRLNAVADLAEADADPIASGPFAGVPLAVKELLAFPGLPWTMGSRLMAQNQAPGLSPYADALRRAGVDVLCSTTSSEFGLLGSTESFLRGVTANPWREGLSAGGSSGSSAALVAAGVVPMAHGNDAGGSLRVPASLNGVFGFLPSSRRTLPTGPDLPGLPSLVVEHVMSRSVRDSARLLAATERTGADAVHQPVGVVERAMSGRLRVAVLRSTLMGGDPEPAVARELELAAKLCESLGHHVFPMAGVDVDADALSRAFFTSAAVAMAQVAQMVAPMLGREPGPDELEPFSLELVEWAATLGPDAASWSQRVLSEAARAYLRVFQECDVVLSPTLARVSWPVGHLAPDVGRAELVRRTEEAVGYTPIHNVAGCPAMSVPLGMDDGLPVGMHVAAPPGCERRLLLLAYELEEAAPSWNRRPDTSWLQGV